jgi:hypothetical protein
MNPLTRPLPGWWYGILGILALGGAGLGLSMVIRRMHALEDPWAGGASEAPPFEPQAVVIYLKRLLHPNEGFVLSTVLFPGVDGRGREDRSDAFRTGADLHFSTREAALEHAEQMAEEARRGGLAARVVAGDAAWREEKKRIAVAA